MLKLSKCILTCLVLVTLNSCYRNVYIPVSTCAEPPELKKPTYMTNMLTGESVDGEILKALLYDFTELRGLYNQCAELLGGYKQKKGP